MGMELSVARTDFDVAAALSKLGYAVIMIDNALVAPNAKIPDGWRDLRVKTPAGTLSLKRREAAIAVVSFGNADAALQAAMRALADALERIS